MSTLESRHWCFFSASVTIWGGIEFSGGGVPSGQPGVFKWAKTSGYSASATPAARRAEAAYKGACALGLETGAYDVYK
eukprot:3987620-Pyramimonas_sp.AAC.1